MRTISKALRQQTIKVNERLSTLKIASNSKFLIKLLILYKRKNHILMAITINSV